jgi:hypothetical protein
MVEDIEVEREGRTVFVRGREWIVIKGGAVGPRIRETEPPIPKQMTADEYHRYRMQVLQEDHTRKCNEQTYGPYVPNPVALRMRQELEMEARADELRQNRQQAYGGQTSSPRNLLDEIEDKASQRCDDHLRYSRDVHEHKRLREDAILAEYKRRQGDKA